jgi:hypothetical protein
LKLLQNFLLVIGATAFGTGFGAVGTYRGMTLVFTEPRGENWGGAIFWLFMMLGGGIVGMIVGFISSLKWVLRRESEPWGPFVWLGAALGAALGLFASFQFSAGVEFWFWLLRVAFIVPACSAIGGLLAGLAVREPKRPQKRRR